VWNAEGKRNTSIARHSEGTFPPLLCGEELSAHRGSYISETTGALLCYSLQDGESDAHNDAGNREE